MYGVIRREEPPGACNNSEVDLRLLGDLPKKLRHLPVLGLVESIQRLWGIELDNADLASVLDGDDIVGIYWSIHICD